MWSALIAALVCVAVFVGIAMVLRRRWRRERAALVERHAFESAAHEQRFVEATASHAAQIEGTTARLSAEIARERHTVEQERLAIAELRDFGRRAIGWDKLSRDDVLASLESAGVTALVATNTMIVHTGDWGRFLTQIDHAVFTEHACAIVESKRWKGLVFDGMKPSEAVPALAALFPDDDLEPPFAVNVKRDTSMTLVVRVHQAREAGGTKDLRPPRQQARAQAVHLRDELARHDVVVPWVSTVVYYSHPDATVFAAPGGPKTDDRTRIASTRAELTQVLAGLLAPRAAGPRQRATVDVDSVAAVLHGWGADLRGTGEWKDRWQSPL